MVTLVDEDDIKHALADLGLTITQTDILAKMKTLCICFNLEPEAFSELWYSYVSKNKKVVRDCPSEVDLELFEKNELAKNMLKTEGFMINIKSEPKVIDSKTEGDEEQIEAETTTVSAIDTKETDYMVTVNSEVEVEPTAEVKDEEMQLELTNEGDQICPSTSVILTSLGEPVNDWISQTSLDCKIVEIGHNTQSEWQTLQIRLHELRELLDEHLGIIAGVIQDKAKIEHWQDLGSESITESFFVGRVAKHSAKDRATAHNLYLEGLCRSCDRIKLDLNEVSECVLFPGQVVGLQGVNQGDKGLRVHAVVNECTSCNLPVEPPKIDTPMSFTVSCGPFEPSAANKSWEKFLEYVCEYKHHFNIMIGPFVDARNPDLFNLDPDETFDSMIKQLEEIGASKKIHFILVPSLRDFTNPNTFPSQPFQTKSKLNFVHFLSSPSVFSVLGVVFGVTSVDILLHFVKEEVTRFTGEQEAGQRMSRLCGHILRQRSFYPLFPPNTDVNMEFSLMNKLAIPVTPHFLIVPSDLKNFCKVVDGCICINPERLTKLTFARCSVQPVTDTYSGSLESSTRIEILKL
ncbi:DNA polymerase alpha subunit B [Halotydeus destructor]|nr:DNA polymerase alpha subunit B [Halotydeus destructor]